MGAIDELKKKSKFTLFVYAFLLDMVIGYVDYVTGYEVGISVFYLAPIGMVVWFVNGKKSIGIYMSLVTSITLTVSNLLAGKVVQYYAVEIWNTLVHFAFFVIGALLIYELKVDREKREKLIRELQQALNEVKTLSGLLPMCSCCKKIRDDKGYWNRVDAYISGHSEAEISHALCPECAQALYPEIYKKMGDKK